MKCSYKPFVEGTKKTDSCGNAFEFLNHFRRAMQIILPLRESTLKPIQLNFSDLQLNLILEEIDFWKRHCFLNLSFSKEKLGVDIFFFTKKGVKFPLR